MRNNLGILLFITKIFVIIRGQELLSEKDYEILKISIDDDSQLLKNATENEYKTILRYGFHRTDACQHYDKAFVCIRKCLDVGYQIAESDKKCQCRCYKNKVLAAYTTKNVSVTSWKLGAPTTTRPSWVKPPSTEVTPNSKPELFADLSPEADSSNENGSGAEDGHENGSAGGESGDGSGDGSNNGIGTETTPLADTNTNPTAPEA